MCDKQTPHRCESRTSWKMKSPHSCGSLMSKNIFDVLSHTCFTFAICMFTHASIMYHVSCAMCCFVVDERTTSQIWRARSLHFTCNNCRANIVKVRSAVVRWYPCRSFMYISKYSVGCDTITCAKKELVVGNGSTSQVGEIRKLRDNSHMLVLKLQHN